jgi:hypothetical protein
LLKQQESFNLNHHLKGITMSTIAFDTLKFVKTLEASGFNAAQAEAIAIAYRDASKEQELVTKKDLQLELAPMKIMLGVVMGGVVALVTKAFF